MLAKYSVIRLNGFKYFNEQRFRRITFLKMNHSLNMGNMERPGEKSPESLKLLKSVL